MIRDALPLGVSFEMFLDELPPVTIEIPTTGERFVGRLSEEPFGPLCLAGPSNRPCYVLSRVLSIGWRVVECTPDERELMGTHGITPDGPDAAVTPAAAARSVVLTGQESHDRAVRRQ